MTPTTPAKRLPSGGQFLMRFQSLFGLAAILILSAILSPVRDGRPVFLAADNLLNIIRFASENGIIAVGMTLVILTGGIDLSVGAVLALCAVGSAACLTRYHLGLGPTVLLMPALGALVGFVNGAITTRLRIQSFIVTLAMMSAARGAASLWSGGSALPLAFGTDAGDAPPLFKSLFAGEVSVLGLAIPAPVFYFLGVGLLASILLGRSVFGRYVYAVGSNAEAARLSGVRVNRVIYLAYAVSAVLAALVGVLTASRIGIGVATTGEGWELQSIAASVIGGASLFGAVGSVIGPLLGAMLLTTINNGANLLNVNPFWQGIITGLLIMVIVYFDQLRRRGRG